MRTASLQLIYESKDISASIARFVTGFEYTDHSDGKADDLQITLEDSDQRWKSDWYPSKGAKITASIISEVDGKRAALDCGVFEIDEIEPSGFPELFTIKAASAAVSKSIRAEKKTVAWESITLREIVGKLAATHGMGAYYEAPVVAFSRIDQRDESDLSFLSRLCTQNGLSLKVSGEKLIVFDGKDFEAKGASFTVSRLDRSLESYRFTDKAHDIYRACEVSYQDPASKADKTYRFTPDNTPAVGEVLKINRRVESLAAAQRVAQAELRKKNKGEVKGSLTMVGHPGMVAGLNLNATGFGTYDGKYFIEEASHRYDRSSSGYVVALTIHRELGY